MATRPRTPKHFPRMKHRAAARDARRLVGVLTVDILPRVPGWLQDTCDGMLVFLDEAGKVRQ